MLPHLLLPPVIRLWRYSSLSAPSRYRLSAVSAVVYFFPPFPYIRFSLCLLQLHLPAFFRSMTLKREISCDAASCLTASCDFSRSLRLSHFLMSHSTFVDGLLFDVYYATSLKTCLPCHSTHYWQAMDHACVSNRIMCYLTII